MDTASVPRPAATVVLVRDGPAGLEVLLTRRPASMAFAPDVHVFPGGRVDESDADPTTMDRAGAGATPAHVAAIRETFEEVGVLLADGGSLTDRAAVRDRLVRGDTTFGAVIAELDLRLWGDRLVPISRWVTPPSLPRRFDARFFVAALPDGVEATISGTEVVDQTWLRPGDALDAMADGRLDMWLPTSTTLQQLRYARSFDEIRAGMSVGSAGEIVVEDVAADVVRIEMPAGGGVDGQPICAYLVGRREVVLIDPGDPTGPGLDRAVAEAAQRGGRITAIALTHADPDHAAGAEAMREQLDVPVLVGPGGGRYLPYPTMEVADGSLVAVGDVPISVIATPGPRPDHVALAIADGKAVLVGDLDGIRGARSIVGPPDDLAWAAAIERVRIRAPGGTWLGGHPPTS